MIKTASREEAVRSSPWLAGLRVAVFPLVSFCVQILMCMVGRHDWIVVTAYAGRCLFFGTLYGAISLAVSWIAAPRKIWMIVLSGLIFGTLTFGQDLATNSVPGDPIAQRFLWAISNTAEALVTGILAMVAICFIPFLGPKAQGGK